MVGERDEAEHRTVTVYSRSEGDAAWQRHARGVLAPDDDAVAPVATAWPPPGAEPLAVEDLYDRLAAAGFDYGPAFQGVDAAWRRGEEVFAELTLDGAQVDESPRFALHPALLDAAFHAIVDALLDNTANGELPLPFSWTGVNLYRRGEKLRVRITPLADGSRQIVAFDDAGEPVMTVESLHSRSVDASRLAAESAKDQPLRTIEWSDLALASVEGGAVRVAALGDVEVGAVVERYGDLDALVADAAAPDVVVVAALGEVDLSDRVAAAHAQVERMLGLLQAWLAEPALADTRLAIVTRAALAVREDEHPDPVAAAVLGLVRSAQSEHPGRVVLLDVDDIQMELAWDALLDADEPQLALRDATLYAPRLITSDVPALPAALDRDATTLIVGGTGGIGAILARHLASDGHRRLLLISRSGPGAAGASELVDELAALGCEAIVAACDAADRDQLATVLATISPKHPLRAVIHAAGVLDDATIETLSADLLHRVLRAKIDSAEHLHDLTHDQPLTEFVLFSSAAATLGSPGQANYAAANAYLDALAHQRQHAGPPGRALAWGLWATTSAMTDNLGDTGTQRLARLGISPLSTEHGLELFDRALATPTAILVAAALNSTALHSQARVNALPALLRGLIRTPKRRHRDSAGTLAHRLASLPQDQWHTTVLDIVRDQVAAVLGHQPHAIDTNRKFKDLGFDSLTAIELRNALTQITGLTLPATIIFDHPTPTALAYHLLTQVGEVAAPRPVIDQELERIEALFESTAGDERERVCARLRALLAAAQPTNGNDARTRIESATAEEIFEFIDSGLG
jgi:NAD(P)-dependent dehydrogenase (short-subunit alcohol dehydrogenase family)/acyl carrier protein